MRDSLPWRMICVALFAITLFCGRVKAAEPPKVDFNRDVRPIFSETCFRCHGPDSAAREADLRLDNPDDALANRGDYFAIVPGNPQESEAYRRLISDDEAEKMPPPDSHLQLTARQIEVIRRWIEQGAEYQKHWSFITPHRPELPAVKKQDWPQNPIDHFILAKLEERGLQPAPQANRETLIRRLSLDLTGLPPTPEEIDDYLADRSEHAYEKVVDRLLDSPAYGERMALQWLDSAGYADTNGYQNDAERYMWRWRDWVINAFNANMPFDQFTIEQLAGDLLPEATLDQQIATGFNRNHTTSDEGGIIPEEYRVDYVANRVETMSTVWLGLTLNCARCHSHKYDPITQEEYYRVFAFFNNIPEKGKDGDQGNSVPFIKAPTPQQSVELERLEAELSKVQQQVETLIQQTADDLAPLAELWTDAAKARLARDYIRKHWLSELEPIAKLLQLKQQQQQLEDAIPTTMVMQEMPQPRQAFVLIRGQYDQHGDEVQPGVPAALTPFPEGAPPNRLGFARWLTAAEHPLTARVTMNRYWKMYFGTGLVKTDEDFGGQGEWPLHVDLLDWLATEFIRSGWDVKTMQKLIVMSAAYQQQSAVSEELLKIDPQNRLISRGPRFRMSAEMIRDNALAASGLLVKKLGGPSVKPYQPAGLWEEISSGVVKANAFEQDHGDDLYRRSLYTFWKRASPPPALQTFDAPTREYCVTNRSRTNTPLQALILMNDVTYVEAARVLAQRLMQEIPENSPKRLTRAYRLVLGREPTREEHVVLLKILKSRLAFYRDHTEAAAQLLSVGEAPCDEKLDPAELAAWTNICSMILCLDETITKG